MTIITGIVASITLTKCDDQVENIYIIRGHYEGSSQYNDKMRVKKVEG